MTDATKSKADLPAAEEPVLANPSEWTQRVLIGNRHLYSKPHQEIKHFGDKSAIWCGTSDALFDLFLNYIDRRWSGEVVIDTGSGVKKIYFVSGQIVFAASNVIDDRLGEVIYRAGLISLDEHAASTVKVGKRKFGQVLLDNGLFSNVQLSQAFKLQVEEIVRSVFLTDYVFAEFLGDYGKKAESEMLFERSVPAMVALESRDLVVDSYTYGLVYRDFAERWVRSATILLNNPEELKKTYSEEKFYGYLIRTIEQSVNGEDLLQKSKLTATHTTWALLDFYLRGICTVEQKFIKQEWAEWVLPLKGKLDVYAMLLTSVRKTFDAEQKAFPIEDLARYGQLLNPRSSEILFFNELGELRKESAQAMFLQSSNYAPRAQYFQDRVEQLIRFLLQTSSDSMSNTSYARIRQTFKGLVG